MQQLNQHFDSFRQNLPTINSPQGLRLICSMNKYFEAKFTRFKETEAKDESVLEHKYEENSLFSLQSESKDRVVQTYLELYFECSQGNVLLLLYVRTRP